MEKINVGVIGCSAIADKTVIPTIKEHEAYNLIMVGSRTSEKGERFAKKYNCNYGLYNDVLNSADIDAVYVSLPSGLHYEWGKKTLEAGKHLLLEKPFTDTYEHAKDIIDYATAHNLVAMEALPYVYHPYFDKLKELIGQNIIGEIRLIESSFGFPYLPTNDIRNNAEIGGGAILDNLIYPLSASISLLGDKYKSISYNLVYNKELGIEDRGFLRLDWDDKCANINFGFGFSYKNTIDIWGSEGAIDIKRAFTKPATMIADIIIEKNNITELITIPAANQFYLMIDAFYKKVVGLDKTKRNENDDVLSRMKVISQMYLNKITHD